MPGLNEGLRNKVVEGGFKIWDWTIDSLDWRYNKMPVDAATNCSKRINKRNKTTRSNFNA